MLANMNRKLNAIGLDGVGILLLSNLIIVATLGLTLLLILIFVARIASASPISVLGRVCIIVPGMLLRNNQLPAEYERRLERAMQLFDNGTSTEIVILGGIVGPNTISEAMAGRNYLMRRGVPKSNFALEQSSRNTFENFRFAKAKITQIGQTETVIVSSRYHLARCGLIASLMNIKHQLCGAEDRLQWSPEILLKLLKEAYYLHCYLCGRYWNIATGRKNRAQQ